MRLRVAVLGGGLGGCAAAIGLQAVGAEVTVYEAAPGPRRGGHGLSLFPKAMAAIRALGIADPPALVVDRMSEYSRRGRKVSDIDMARVSRRAGGFPYADISREGLLDHLLPSVSHVEYDRRAREVRNNGASTQVVFDSGPPVEADLVVAADGSASTIRSQLWPEDKRVFNSVAWQATVTQPDDYPGPAESCLHRGSSLFAGTFPEPDGIVGYFLQHRIPGSYSLDAARSSLTTRLATLPSPFRQWFSAVEMDPFPIYLRRPPRSWGRGRVVVLGDAAHSISPSGGQGASEAFHDAVALADAVSTAKTPEQAITAYGNVRHRRSLRTFWMAAQPMTPVLSGALAPMAAIPDPILYRMSNFAFGPEKAVLEVLSKGGLRP